jgi:plastocyanin
MKLDLTRLPVGEAIIGFLVLVLAVTFTGAFIAKGGGESGGGAVSASPLPTSGASPQAGTPTPGGGGGGGGGQALTLTLGDNFFQLDSQKNPNLKVKAGSTVTIQLTNKGTAIHNMRIAGEDNTYNNKDDAVSDPQLVTAGQSAKIEWKAPNKTGDYNYQCDFHPTDMKGVITVE